MTVHLSLTAIKFHLGKPPELENQIHSHPKLVCFFFSLRAIHFEVINMEKKVPANGVNCENWIFTMVKILMEIKCSCSECLMLSPCLIRPLSNVAMVH